MSLADAVHDVRGALHKAFLLVERRVADGTATYDERALVDEFRQAWDLMRAERIAFDNAFDEHDGIAEALNELPG